MLKKRSIKWKMTILSAIVIFLIFMICNIIQLIPHPNPNIQTRREIIIKTFRGDSGLF